VVRELQVALLSSPRVPHTAAAQVGAPCEGHYSFETLTTRKNDIAELDCRLRRANDSGAAFVHSDSALRAAIFSTPRQHGPSRTSRARAGRTRRRDRICGIGPVQARQVMQRDTRSPAVRGRPDKQRHQQTEHRQAQRRMQRHDSEINQDDHHANRHAIADDGEGPRITRIPNENQAAD
jgi:hypothetical protein